MRKEPPSWREERFFRIDPMIDPRPCRSGLGFSEAVIIKSAPLPSSTARLLASDALDSSGRYQDYATWKEWTINPAKHGQLARPPVFLPSQQVYDELGRSTVDGISVEVEDGRQKGVEGGEQVAEWYLGLAKGNTVEAGPSKDCQPVDCNESSASRASPPGPPSGQPEMATTEKLDMPLQSIPRPVRAYRTDWFLRRRPPFNAPSFSTSKAARPSSISALLNIPPSQSRVPPAHYVLGPENKGYALLRDRLGWEGGGLGRPAGWTEEVEGTRERASTLDEEAKPELDINGHPIVDLTVDSAIDSDSEHDYVPISHGGPGRTAPIATALKLDRLGIGHRRARPKVGMEAVKK